MKCVECDAAKAEYDDPRDPPMEEGLCLCGPCFVGCADERCSELEAEIVQLREEAIIAQDKIDTKAVSAKKRGRR